MSMRWTHAPGAQAIIVLVAVASRFATFGNPLVIVDDQFYHFVGQAMLDGQWPYIDVWDRKPIGLFLIFAGIAAIGGGSVIAMQLIATGFAIVTAWVIRHIALRFASPGGALFAALAYLIMLPLFGGQSAQSPIFYNLLIASAAALLIGASETESRGFVARAMAAMLLCGSALIIKQSSVVEGMFIGLGFLWLARRRGMAIKHLAGLAAVMVGVALAPSMIALLAYALRGDEARDAYVFANFASIFLKQSHGATARLAGIAFFLLYIFPLVGAAIAGAVIRRRAGAVSDSARLLEGWMIAAFAGYLAIPSFFDHYALPLLVPLAVSAASLFGRAGGPLYAAAIGLFALIQGAMMDFGHHQRERVKFERVNAVIHAAAKGGCLFVANGPSQFFIDTPPCRASAYIFPDHLTTMVESTALGVDQGTELANMLAARPAIIAVTEEARGERLPVINRELDAALRANYRAIYHVPADDRRSALRSLRVWQRRDLAGPQR